MTAVCGTEFVRNGVIKGFCGRFPLGEVGEAVLGAIANVAFGIDTNRTLRARPSGYLGDLEGIVTIDVGVVGSGIDINAGTLPHCVGVWIAFGGIIFAFNRNRYLGGVIAAMAITHLVFKALAGAGALGQVIEATCRVVNHPAGFKDNLSLICTGIGWCFSNAQHVAAVDVLVVAFGADLNRAILGNRCCVCVGDGSIVGTLNRDIDPALVLGIEAVGYLVGEAFGGFRPNG